MRRQFIISDLVGRLSDWPVCIVDSTAIVCNNREPTKVQFQAVPGGGHSVNTDSLKHSTKSCSGLIILPYTYKSNI